VNDPKLAALDVADRALFVAGHALLAAHPVLMTEDQPDESDELACLAERIHGFALVLGDDLVRYRDAARGRAATMPASVRETYH
jgi:hypothetical protein